MPSYETKLDKENETIIAEAIGKYLKIDLQPNARFAPADFSTPYGNIHVEIRCRNCKKEKYPNIIISATKWIELLRLKASDDQPQVYFAVCWLDYLGIVELDFGAIELIPFRRNKSIGTHQTDVMVSMPIHTFTIIGSSPRLTKSKNWI